VKLDNSIQVRTSIASIAKDKSEKVRSIVIFIHLLHTT